MKTVEIRSDRQIWEDAADALLEGVARYQSPSGSRFNLPGPRPSANGAGTDGLEGFARTFWLAACRARYATPDRRSELVDRYIPGFDAGTNPDHPEAWPRVSSTPQVMVESASLAFGLHYTRPWLWDNLSAAVQRRTVAFLRESVDRPGVTGNWIFFRILVHAFLRSVGESLPTARTLTDLDEIDACYRGHGWYSDGSGPECAGKFDYYNAWSFNLYPALWSDMEGRTLEPARVARFADRSAQHTDSLLHMIGSDGRPVYQGRSLTYRAAMTSSFAAAALIDAPHAELGRLRNASTRVLRYFLDHGATVDSVLTLGWLDEYEPITQMYSGPGSPYWMSKAFTGLLLPPDHEYWTAPALPLPVEESDFIRVERAPGWILQGTQADGIVRALNHGGFRSLDQRDPHSRHLRDDPNYARVAYSTHTAPTLDLGRATDRDRQSPIPDNSVTVRTVDGRYALRERAEIESVGNSWIVTLDSLRLSDTGEVVQLQRLSAVRGPIEVRAARLLNPNEHHVFFSGYAVPDPLKTTITSQGCTVESRTGLRSLIHSIGAGAEQPQATNSPRNAIATTNLLPYTAFSTSRTSQWQVVACALSTAAEPTLHNCISRIAVTASAGTVMVEWDDGDNLAIPVREYGTPSTLGEDDSFEKL